MEVFFTKTDTYLSLVFIRDASGWIIDMLDNEFIVYPRLLLQFFLDGRDNCWVGCLKFYLFFDDSLASFVVMLDRNFPEHFINIHWAV